MSLKSRIDSGLAADGFTVRQWGNVSPESVASRFMGWINVNGRSVPRAEVRLAVAVSTSKRAQEVDVEATASHLIDALNRVVDCYPQREQIIVDYDERYITVSVVCYGV